MHLQSHIIVRGSGFFGFQCGNSSMCTKNAAREVRAPGQMVRTSWTDVVTPGVLPTLTTRVRLRLLIKDDFPTLGSPMIPAARPPHFVTATQWIAQMTW